MIPIARPLLGEEEAAAAARVVCSGMLASGPEVAAFESEFAAYTGAGHAIAVSNGTTALHAALLGAGIGHGDEVIVPSFTFIATATAVSMCGAVPVFADVRRDLLHPRHGGRRKARHAPDEGDRRRPSLRPALRPRAGPGPL